METFVGATAVAPLIALPNDAAPPKEKVPTVEVVVDGDDNENDGADAKTFDDEAAVAPVGTSPNGATAAVVGTATATAPPLPLPPPNEKPPVDALGESPVSAARGNSPPFIDPKAKDWGEVSKVSASRTNPPEPKLNDCDGVEAPCVRVSKIALLLVVTAPPSIAPTDPNFNGCNDELEAAAVVEAANEGDATAPP